jgi:hypothetical protein
LERAEIKKRWSGETRREGLELRLYVGRTGDGSE